MAIRGRAPAAPPPPPNSGGGVNFGAPGFFSAGFGLPEGRYALLWETEMYTPTKKDGTSGNPFLSVTLTAFPIDTAGNSLGEPVRHELKCGTNAHQSFMPSGDGKGFEAVPGGSSTGLSGQANFGIFWDSLVKCGMPPNYVTTSFEPLDGLWVRTSNIPEPEERKQLRSRTGEAAMMAGAEEGGGGNRKCAVVIEVLEGGKPWEGGGGLPEGVEVPTAPPVKPGPRRVTRGATPAAAAARRAPAPVAPAPEPEGDVDAGAIESAASDGITNILSIEANSGGMSKLALRTQVFKDIGKNVSDDMAQAVQETYMLDDAALNTILGPLGYKVAGAFIKPV